MLEVERLRPAGQRGRGERQVHLCAYFLENFLSFLELLADLLQLGNLAIGEALVRRLGPGRGEHRRLGVQVLRRGVLRHGRCGVAAWQLGEVMLLRLVDIMRRRRRHVPEQRGGVRRRRERGLRGRRRLALRRGVRGAVLAHRSFDNFSIIFQPQLRRVKEEERAVRYFKFQMAILRCRVIIVGTPPQNPTTAPLTSPRRRHCRQERPPQTPRRRSLLQKLYHGTLSSNSLPPS